MMTSKQLKDMAAALRSFDRSLTAAEAEDMAAQIGDTPQILDGEIWVSRGGEDYAVPAEVVIPESF